MNSNSIARALSTLGLAALLMTGAASAADVRVMISAGFYGVYAELGPAFERSSGHRLVTTRGPSMGDSPEAIPTRLVRGEAADVVILDGGAADELGQNGLILANSKLNLARSLIGMVVRGEAEIGFQQVAELIHVPGITFVGVIPADVQPTTFFAGALTAKAREPDAGFALLRFLASPEAAAVIVKAGLMPVSGR